MTLRDVLLPVVWIVRGLPGQFGLHRHTVEIGLGAWTGAVTGEGTLATTWTPIVENGGQPPKVRWLKTEELAVGALQKGSVQIGPITPDFSGGGTSAGTLMLASIQTGQTRHVRITGPQHPNGALYVIQNSDFGSALHYTLVCEPIAEQSVTIGDTNFLTDSSGNILTDGGNQLNNA